MIMEIFGDLEPMAVAVITAAVVGAVELVKRLYDREWQAAVTIVVAALVGFGLSFAVDITWYYGLIIGLAGSGLITGLSKIGKTTG